MRAITRSKLIPGSPKIEFQSANQFETRWDSELSKEKCRIIQSRGFFFSNHDVTIGPVDFFGFVIFLKKYFSSSLFFFSLFSFSVSLFSFLFPLLLHLPLSRLSPLLFHVVFIFFFILLLLSYFSKCTQKREYHLSGNYYSYK